MYNTYGSAIAVAGNVCQYGELSECGDCDGSRCNRNDTGGTVSSDKRCPCGEHDTARCTEGASSRYEEY